MMFHPDKVFVSTLSEGERFIFLKVICGLVAADRKVSADELKYLKEMAVKYDVSPETLATMVKTADKHMLLKQARMINSRPKALMLIKDLCFVANNDVALADEEIDYILDVAQVLDIEPERVQEINEVVNEYLAVSQKAALLLEQDNW